MFKGRLVTITGGLFSESIAREHLQPQLKHRFAYSKEYDTWYKFIGTHWRACKGDFEVREYVSALLDRATEPVGYPLRYLNNVLKLLENSQLQLPVGSKDKLPFANGLLNPLTRELEPITQDNALTWCIPHNYTRDADCPRYKELLEHVSNGDEGYIRMLRAYGNAIIHRRADYQKFLYLDGDGGTGKSSIMHCYELCVGPENVESTTLRELEENRFELAKLRNKSLILIPEANEHNGKADKFKALIGQDPLPYEEKYKQQGRSFINTGMVLVTGNTTPRFSDYTSGFARRLTYLKFKRRFTSAERQAFESAGGKKQYDADVAGIINYFLDMPRSEVDEMFYNPPDSVVRSTNEAICEQNSVAGWLATCTKFEKKARLLLGAHTHRVPYHSSYDGRMCHIHDDLEAYPNYLTYCANFGIKPISTHKFKRAVLDMAKQLGHSISDKHTKKGICFVGLTLSKNTVCEETVDIPESTARPAGGDGDDPTQ